MNTHVTPPSSWLDLRGAQEFAADDAQMRELMATFETSLSQEIAAIEASLLAHEAMQAERALHALKGFLSLFAAPPLAHRVAELYQDSRNQSLIVTKTRFESIQPDLMALLGEVRAWLGRL